MAVALPSDASNIEHEVILENLSFIVEGLTYQLYPMCVKFVEKRLISDYELGNIKSQPSYDAGAEIMRSIMSKVKADPEVFYVFISVLEDLVPNVAMKLNAALKEKKDQQKVELTPQKVELTPQKVEVTPQKVEVTPQADQPVGTNKSPSDALINDTFKRSVSSPAYTEGPESNSHFVFPISDSTFVELNDASGLRPSSSDTELLRYMDNKRFTDLQPNNKPKHFSHSRSNSFDAVMGSSEHNSLYFKPTSPNIVNAYPVEQESDVDEPWSFVFIVNEDKPWKYDYVVNAPLENVKVKKFWDSDSKVERGLSLGKSLEQQLEVKNKEIAELKSQLEKSQAEVAKFKVKNAAAKQRELQKVQIESMYDLRKAEQHANEIILKLRKEIVVLARDMKSKDDSEVYVEAAAWLKKIIEEVIRKSDIKKFK